MSTKANVCTMPNACIQLHHNYIHTLPNTLLRKVQSTTLYNKGKFEKVTGYNFFKLAQKFHTSI